MLLIDISNHLLDFVDEVDDSLKPYYYESLRILMNRGEFSLDSVGFSEEYQNFLKTKADTVINESLKGDLKKLNLKIETSLQYQKLLYRALKKALEKLVVKVKITFSDLTLYFFFPPTPA